MNPPFFSAVVTLAVCTGTFGAAQDHTCTGATDSNGVCTSAPAPGTAASLGIYISPEQPQCGLYMAPSTLGEGANLGMYAGTDIPKGKDIQQEIAIPFMFRDWDGPSFFHQYPNITHGDHDDGALWYRYIWSGWVADLETYDINNVQNEKVVFVPGIGCTINSILDMRNVESTHGSTYDTAGLGRGDPSAGAFCPYHSTHTVSKVAIPQGGEIFADYGPEWIPEIPGAQIAFNDVMDSAEDFLRDEFVPFIKLQGKKLKARVLEGLWKFTQDLPIASSKPFTVLPRNNVTWKEIQKQLDAYEKIEAPIMKAFEQQKQHGFDPAFLPAMPYYSERTSLIRHFIRRNGQRSMEWLRAYGRCCDHMRPDNSTIPHAGRGAFATRALPRGTIVGYSPMVHVGTYARDLYNIPYEMGPNGSESYVKKDLIYNYAFYHPNSTVMLSPYGSMVNYINHASSDLNLSPNVRVVWPDTEMMAHKPAWLEKDVDFLTYTLEKIGLSFDYVALRDIEEGEEILMDYGKDWEVAWKEHVEKWEDNRPKDAEEYVHSSQWTEETLRTENELKENPYPPNLQTICIPAYMWDLQKGAYMFLNLKKSYIDRIRCRVLERLPAVSSDSEGNKVKSSTAHKYVYTVELLFDDKTIPVLNFPKDAIFVTDRIMSQDWHLRNTFRHPIAIPDDIFPTSWINQKDDPGEIAGIVDEKSLMKD